jgi:hypothetical protein
MSESVDQNALGLYCKDVRANNEKFSLEMIPTSYVPKVKAQGSSILEAQRLDSHIGWDMLWVVEKQS